MTQSHARAQSSPARTTILNGVSYAWQPAPVHLAVLYGAPLILSSRIPVGMVMTLRNIHDAELTIRGERHGEDIRFYHLTGEGSMLIGAWVKTDYQREEEPSWAAVLRARFDAKFRAEGRK